MKIEISKNLNPQLPVQESHKETSKVPSNNEYYGNGIENTSNLNIGNILKSSLNPNKEDMPLPPTPGSTKK